MKRAISPSGILAAIGLSVLFALLAAGVIRDFWPLAGGIIVAVGEAAWATRARRGRGGSR